MDTRGEDGDRGTMPAQQRASPQNGFCSWRGTTAGEPERERHLVPEWGADRGEQETNRESEGSIPNQSTTTRLIREERWLTKGTAIPR